MRESAFQAACAGDDGKRRNRHTILKQAAAGIKKISVDIPNIDRNDIDFFSDISEQGEADKNTIFQNVKKKY